MKFTRVHWRYLVHRNEVIRQHVQVLPNASMGCAKTLSDEDLSVSNDTKLPMLEILWPRVKLIINNCSTIMKPFCVV